VFAREKRMVYGLRFWKMMPRRGMRAYFVETEDHVHKEKK
jgi:hypothetical protein